MGSDQISETALPSRKRCPYCGEINTSPMRMCWLCLEKMSFQEGTADPRDTTGQVIDARGGRAPPSDSAAFAGVGILGAMIALTLAIEAPGMLIVLAILALPALLRTVFVIQHTSAAPAQRFGGYLLAFTSALGVATLVGIVGFVAFGIGFTITCFGQIYGLEKETGMMISLVVAGTFAAIPTLYLIWRLWLKE